MCARAGPPASTQSQALQTLGGDGDGCGGLFCPERSARSGGVPEPPCPPPSPHSTQSSGFLPRSSGCWMCSLLMKPWMISQTCECSLGQAVPGSGVLGCCQVPTQVLCWRAGLPAARVGVPNPGPMAVAQLGGSWASSTTLGAHRPGRWPPPEPEVRVWAPSVSRQAPCPPTPALRVACGRAADLCWRAGEGRQLACLWLPSLHSYCGGPRARG